MKLLAVSPHCDDAELGAGAWLASADSPVIYVACAENALRVDEAARAAEILGADVRLGSAVDRAAAAHLDAMRAEIERLIEETRPAYILLPPERDVHQDHVAVNQAVLQAARRSPITLLEYQTPSAPVGWAPDFFVRVDETDVTAMERALRCYFSQSANVYMEPGRATARRYAHGQLIGTRYAEGFKLVRGVL